MLLTSSCVASIEDLYNVQGGGLGKSTIHSKRMNQQDYGRAPKFWDAIYWSRWNFSVDKLLSLYLCFERLQMAPAIR
jgi:hypothetical protein